MLKIKVSPEEKIKAVERYPREELGTGEITDSAGFLIKHPTARNNRRSLSLT